MPQGEQHDIEMAYKLVNHLGIKYFEINVKDAVEAILNNFPKDIEITPQTVQNIPSRVRMTTLYAVSQSVNGRVCNTCNLSEDWLGYSTRYGDSVGDFSPMSNLTVTEVKEIGRLLGLPTELVEKLRLTVSAEKPMRIIWVLHSLKINNLFSDNLLHFGYLVCEFIKPQKRVLH